jgi:5-methyltetrahydrofolate--homocysteine methyltransferase
VVSERILSAGGERVNAGKVVMATVEGDVHDIGKNIVCVMLKSYGFEVIDLGRDVCADTVVAAAQDSGASVVGLSALMTTTVPAMEKTIKALREKLPSVKVVVGGAVLTEAYSARIGADKYAPDAMATVRYATEVYQKN